MYLDGRATCVPGAQVIIYEQFECPEHFADGTWAHKIAGNPSVQLGAINPSTYTWYWGGPNYNSETVYFAVEAESPSFTWE